jgi:hypothetical protein
MKKKDTVLNSYSVHGEMGNHFNRLNENEPVNVPGIPK